MVKSNGLTNSDAALQSFEKSVIAAWYEKINNDVRNDPIKGDMFTPYGTTLLAAAITEFYWFAIQIGDGKCFIINRDGCVSHPVPWDERCFLNRTTSLCDNEANNNFRHYYSEILPAAIFLGSDGIDDSFPVNNNNEHLTLFYKNIYENFISEGLHKGETQLREMLPLLTQKGSGDDISIAGIINSPLQQP